MYRRGATLCAACSGVLLLAETGLLDGREATMHWSVAATFRERFPEVKLRVEEPLVVTGDGGRLVMSGAGSSWADLVLYLIREYVGPTAAQAIAKFYAFEPHWEGLSPYVPFEPPRHHADAVVRRAQQWLAEHHAEQTPVEGVVQHAGVAPRTFKRRFKSATGYSVIDYVQRLRVEQAKRQLERTAQRIDEVARSVGYADPASFRRVFKRITGLAPARYRRKISVPTVVPC